MARRMIFELIAALIAAKSVLADVRLKSGQIRSMGPSWRVVASISCAKSEAAVVRMSSAPRKMVRQYTWLSVLDFAQALGKFNIVLMPWETKLEKLRLSCTLSK